MSSIDVSMPEPLASERSAFSMSLSRIIGVSAFRQQPFDNGFGAL